MGTWWRKVALMLAAGLISVPGAASAKVAPTWTHDGYGPGNTGYNPAESVVNAATITKLKLRWRAVPRAGTEGCQQQTTPVVAGGRVFLVDGDGVGAFDLRTGRRLWSDTTVMDAMVHRTMTVAGGLVITSGYSCYGTSDPGGHIVALDAVTGKVRWSRIEGSATMTVLVDGSTLVSFSACEVCSSYVVSGYRLTDGVRKWSRDGLLATPVSAGGRLLLSAGASGSFAVSAATGAQLWQSGIAWNVIAANPAGSQFYVRGPKGRFAAVNAATGKVLWSVPAAAGELAADGTRVYVSRGDRITAYRAGDGRRLWFRTGIAESRPVRAGGLLYLAGSVLSPVNGSLVLSATYSTPFQHAVVADGKVLRVKGLEVQAYGP
ncbi:PQQ-binding-like beta-propeller repeat protein [Actinoplanes sp. NPDC051494]|uniref:outer membrane protein assembly factor BamB family protein n=1 Tax=Actinoplanes sp. NPDC051494 TaxID=3363907 RepID=UPI0037A2F95D